MTDNERRELWGEDKREAGKCGAPRSVAPCAALGVASLDTAMPVKVQEGNPVNPLTGQKYQVELDAAPQPGPLGLELKRHYNSALGVVKHPLGRAWTFSYDTRVFTTATTVQIVQADGHRLMFRRPDVHSKRHVSGKRGLGKERRPPLVGAEDHASIVCTSDLAENGSVLMLPAGGHEWRWPSGRRLRFNPQGHLIEIREPVQALPTAERPAQSETVGYAHGSGQGPAKIKHLTQTQTQPKANVTEASGNGQTGDAIQAWHVLRIERDAQGRMLRVTDPAGRQMHFSYDHRGHLSTIDHPRGQWRYQVSAKGQLLSVTSPTRAQRFYRYEDPGFPSALTAIETGAPMLGQRLLQGRWRYDAQGRVIEYRGPAGDRRFRYWAADAKGIATTEVSDSEGRKKIYRFREAFGQWQVLSVTGQDCAHCGPADRHFRYDDQGRLVGLRDEADLDALSLARLYRIEHDPLGRVARIYLRTWAVPSGEGKKPPSKGDETLTLFRRYEYADDQSRLPSLVARPSVLPGKEYTVAYEYQQIAGQQRPVRITERGYSHGIAVSRSARFVYDDTGRLIQMDGPLPGEADRIDFKSEKDETGQVRVRMLTAWGDEVDVSMDGGWLRSSLNWLMDNGRFHAEAGALRHVAPNGASQRIHVDDFGRITKIESPDAGVETTYHDAADRVIRQTDSTGADLRIKYDERDRPLLKTLTAPDGKVLTTRYRYEGRHLVAVSSPVSTERYQYDERGRMVLREAVIHPTPDVPAQRFSTRFGYEGERDWPTRITLPNGAVIERKLADNWHRVSLLNQTDAETPVELYRRQLKAGPIDEQLSQALWLFGNGLRRELAWTPQGRLLMLRDGRADEKTGEFEQIVTGELLSHAPGGRISAISTPDGLQRFAYNRAGQLIIAESTAKPAWWYAYDDNGNRVFSGRHLPSQQSRQVADGLSRDSGGGIEGKAIASEKASRHAAPDERRSVAAVNRGPVASAKVSLTSSGRASLAAAQGGVSTRAKNTKG
ncbi:MAG: DUF6531 domain-containing protein, partial [Lautropia sp.]|nr:DUF6531 domain-containing protein [Lautropia sp.]